jgi:LacI family transcriptional regulator
VADKTFPLGGHGARPGIRDVAAEAGVSVTTVSHVLNDVAGTRVTEATRQRVQDAARRLGYAPNQLARGLRMQRSQTVGLISDRIATLPFAGNLIAGAQDAAREQGSVLIVVNTGGDPELEEREARVLMQRQVDGVLYATWYHREVVVPGILRSVPTVLVDASSTQSEISSVVPDEVAGGRVAAEELLRAGHRRVTFINDHHDVPAARGRLAGFLAALEGAGVPRDGATVVRLQTTTPVGFTTAMALLSSPDRPTGVFCYNDRVAMGVYQAATELGLRIPADLSVVGFDNQEIIADALRPGLTTVQLPHYEMGAWAVDQLYRIVRLPAGEVAPAVHVQLAGPLIRRGSVGPPPP